ncbi:hypothetical protein L838_2374 [Mycobacterium avium MAV_120709_2344]|nr:hypothetical protein L838_2374 [Mycobacterium avium MAV_120709_2344]
MFSHRAPPAKHRAHSGVTVTPPAPELTAPAPAGLIDR